MPVLKSAIKKLRQDKKREKQNDALRNTLKESIREAKKTKTGKAVSKASSLLDKAAKKNLLHSNKAARIKSTLAKIAKPVKSKTQAEQKTKKSAPKTKKSPAKK